MTQDNLERARAAQRMASVECVERTKRNRLVKHATMGSAADHRLDSGLRIQGGCTTRARSRQGSHNSPPLAIHSSEQPSHLPRAATRTYLSQNLCQIEGEARPDPNDSHNTVQWLKTFLNLRLSFSPDLNNIRKIQTNCGCFDITPLTERRRLGKFG
ncbi:hypothetical protein DFH09DRAFT_1071358 [Mycena vulgaris]|nr:hypothetical protein DFH09DRAFT_1071358 [Mycena vulgaris]